MCIRNWQFMGGAVLLGGLFSAVALTGTPPTLTDAMWSGNQFQFTLRGQTNVSYIIQSSSDLRTWTPVVTNSDPRATRTVVLPAAQSAAFWRIQRVPGPLFEYAIAARGSVSLGGSGRIDSFNSTNALESTNGRYDPAKATDRAGIASGLTNTNAVNVGNVKVLGTISLEPLGAVSIGPNGGVGSSTFINNPVTAGMIEPGHLRDDMNFAFAAAKFPIPYGPIWPLPPGSVGGTNYKYVLADHDYAAASITLAAGERILITGKARMYVTGQTRVTGNGYILIGPDASIEWYARGEVDLGGVGCLNSSGLAQSFSIIGLSTSTSIRYSGSAPLIGTIYAPTATVTIVGNSDATAAVVGNAVTLSGDMGLHFDESLRHAGPFY